MGRGRGAYWPRVVVWRHLLAGAALVAPLLGAVREHLGLAPWVVDEPNGGRDQNCVSQTSPTLWWDEPCISPSNVDCVCQLNNEAYFVFRGLCLTSLLSNSYFPQEESLKALSFFDPGGNTYI